MSRSRNFEKETARAAYTVIPQCSVSMAYAKCAGIASWAWPPEPRFASVPRRDYVVTPSFTRNVDAAPFPGAHASSRPQPPVLSLNHTHTHTSRLHSAARPLTERIATPARHYGVPLAADAAKPMTRPGRDVTVDCAAAVAPPIRSSTARHRQCCV